jgi:glycosyltransferase involved in cell wall biosynthesis
MQPLISCICITRNRPHLLSVAIFCFKEQCYSHKELVILYEKDDIDTATYLDKYTRGDINIKIVAIERQSGQYLGALRNKAIAAASGDYICQWDDDDWYHPKRLSYQYEQLISKRKAACVLGREIIWDNTTGKAYLSCYRHWEGSLMCCKNIAMQHPYNNYEKGEDTPMITALLTKGLLYTDTAITPLYVYRYHGANTWDYRHFSSFFPYSILLPDAVSNLFRHILKEKGITSSFLQECDAYFHKEYFYTN